MDEVEDVEGRIITQLLHRYELIVYLFVRI